MYSLWLKIKHKHKPQSINRTIFISGKSKWFENRLQADIFAGPLHGGMCFRFIIVDKGIELHILDGNVSSFGQEAVMATFRVICEPGNISQ